MTTVTSAPADNIFQAVATFQRSGLAFFQNECCHLHLSNKKFENFQDKIGNLGTSITFDLPPRFAASNGLVYDFQPAVQRPITLTVSQAANVPFAVDAQQMIYNFEQNNYETVFGDAALIELANVIEGNLALNWISGVRYGDATQSNFGQLNVNSGPYRFFNDGVTPITTYQQLQQFITLFKNFGAVKTGIKVVIPDIAVPAIIGSGLNQFAPRRNDEIAMSWELGEFGAPPVEYYVSNLLPTHFSGDVGNADRATHKNRMTVVNTNDPTGNNITAITYSVDASLANDANAIKAGDLIQFNNINYLTFVGHFQSRVPVQVRAVADAATVGTSVTVTFTPALSVTPGGNQNIPRNIIAGMTADVAPSHIAGGIISDDAFYVAMPKLPDTYPFPSASAHDAETGATVRMSKGVLWGQNIYGWAYDQIWDSLMVPDYSGRILFPLNN